MSKSFAPIMGVAILVLLISATTAVMVIFNPPAVQTVTFGSGSPFQYEIVTPELGAGSTSLFLGAILLIFVTSLIAMRLEAARTSVQMVVLVAALFVSTGSLIAPVLAFEVARDDATVGAENVVAREFATWNGNRYGTDVRLTFDQIEKIAAGGTEYIQQDDGSLICVLSITRPDGSVGIILTDSGNVELPHGQANAR